MGAQLVTEWDATAYVTYAWDCPACGAGNDCGDIEPVGDVECEDCGATVTIT